MRMNPQVPPELERIILKALEKDRDLRYQSASELRADLKRLKRDTSAPHATEVYESASASMQSQQKTIAPSAPTVQTEPAHKKRSILPFAIAFGVIACVLGYVFYTQSPRNTSDQSPPQLSFTQLTDQGGQEAEASISPDGNYVIYRSGPRGNSDIYLLRIGGRNPINLTKDSTVDDVQPAYSPDGQFISFRSEREGGGIFIMGATGESVKKLTNFGYHPAWSPDGKQIAFATEGPASPLTRLTDSKLWTVNVQTEEKKLLYEVDAVQPDWSPNNLRIAFWALNLRGGQRDLVTIPANGGKAVFVTNDAAVDWKPVWSPDGKYLYFISDRGGSMNVWRIAIDEQTGNPQGEPQALVTPSRWSGDLSFARDGKMLVFTSSDNQANIESIEFDPLTGNTKGASTPVTTGTVEYLDLDVSPDGNWIVYRSHGPQEDLFVARSDGTEVRRLTNDVYKDRGPVWSPDGSRIAFYSNRTGSGIYEAWAIKPDGSSVQQITKSEAVLYPCWSPDGKRIAGGFDLQCRIFDVSKPLPVQGELVPKFGDSVFFPRAWSPDGKWIAGGVWDSEGAVRDLYLYSLETQRFEKLAETLPVGLKRPPSWLDNNRIIYQNGDEVLLMNLVTKKTTPIHVNAGGTEITSVRITKDNNRLYFIRGKYEADLWVMRMK